MEFIPIKTKVFQPPKDDFFEELDRLNFEFKDKDILIITSKVVAIHQGLCFSKDNVSRDDLIKSEADYILEENNKVFPLTYKDNMLVPFSGVDESNANGYFITLPKNSDSFAREVHDRICEKFKLKNFAVLIIDSNCLPLRYGLIGLTIGFYGINPIIDYEGKKDIFDRELKISRLNVIDSIASFSTLIMGQGNEITPMVVLRNFDKVQFEKKSNWDIINIEKEEDFYTPFLNLFEKSN